MKILPTAEQYEERKRLRPFVFSAHWFSIEALETEADRLREQFQIEADNATSPYHLGSNALDKAWRAEHLIEAAEFLRSKAN